MGDIQDFSCTYNRGEIDIETIKRWNLAIPDIYIHADKMASAAQKMREYSGAPFCMLPFCHTVEAEALGGIIHYGNEAAGPRTKEFVCRTPEELLDLPSMDLESGRIHQVLLACRYLKEQKEYVVLQITGPLTILSQLIDAGYVFRALRKNAELMRTVFQNLGKELLGFAEAAKEYGADMISYGDPAGGFSILGPKMMEQMVEDFTYEFLRQLEKKIGKNVMIHLCPKTAFALLGTGYAKFEEIELNAPVNYGQACVEMIGRAPSAGQMCIKNWSCKLENSIFRAVKLI